MDDMVVRAYERERRRVEILERIIEDKTRELFLEKQGLEHMTSYLRAIFETLQDALFVCSEECSIIMVNEAAVALTGLSRETLVGMPMSSLVPAAEELAPCRSMTERKSMRTEGFLTGAQGREIPVGLSIARMTDGSTKLVGFVCLLHDLTERRELEQRLLQGQKLEAVGTLAAGIAHELNTPIQFVGDNTTYLGEAIESYNQFIEEAEALIPTEARERWHELLERFDLAHYREEIPRAIEQTREGVTRVTGIVKAMKEFAHPDGDGLCEVDLGEAIRSTVTVSRNEWKYRAKLELDLAEGLPRVPLYVGEFNQAVLNLIVNAADAIEERFGGQGILGEIRVKTAREGDFVRVSVTDNGGGIPDHLHTRIFDHFFTTKEIGRGTGQGLSVVRNSVEKRHGGRVSFESTFGQGTTFHLDLPLAAD